MPVKCVNHLMVFTLIIAAGILGLGESTQAAVPAFPGAEGGGAESIGGRGGTVIEVTNLNDSGPGSFRAACEASGSRIVVFRVGGIIDLNSPITIANPYITIAGQTAPGGGILIRGSNAGDSPIFIRAHNVIIRFIKVRVGYGSFESQKGDCISIRGPGSKNVVIDHCSFSWASDENLEVWSDDGTILEKMTFSWNIISEALDYGGHSKGFIIGTHTDAKYNMTEFDIHHNIFMSNAARNPYLGVKTQTVINNIVYNWASVGDSYGTGGRGGLTMDIIGNIYKKGPESDNADIKWYPSNPPCIIPGDPSIYIQGNIGVGNGDPDADNWDMIMGWSSTQGTFPLPRSYERLIAQSVTHPQAHPINVHHIYNDSLENILLSDAGASKRLDQNGNWVSNRDAVDIRLIQEYQDGTGQIPVDEDSVGGFPIIASGTPYTDTDHDAMPDVWETANGFNPNNASDGPQDADGDGYTNVEEFLNGEYTTPEPQTYTILKTASSPVIDGNIAEFETANEIQITSPITGTIGTYKLLWDDTALYIASSVTDTRLNADNTERDGNLWEDDSIEMMFDTLHNAGSSPGSDDYKFWVNVLNTHTDGQAGDKSWNADYTSAVIATATGTINNNTDTDTGYTMEIVIPWSNWGITPPEADTIFGFDLALNDNNGITTYQTPWSNSDGGSLNNPDGWGDMVFSQVGLPTATFTPTRTNTPGLPTATFTPTRTSTPGLPTATFTPTRTSTPGTPVATFTPSITSTPGSPLPTLASTPSNTFTPSPTCTATLVAPLIIKSRDKVAAFPNPASGNQVTFSYSLAAEAKVEIKIYNVAGKLVTVLTEKKAGAQGSTLWNIKNLGSGVYFAQITLTYNNGKVEKMGLKKVVIKK